MNVGVEYPFESVLVRNRLGQGMNVLVCPFSVCSNHVCVLVRLPESLHPSHFAKSAEHIVFQLRERFSREVKQFSMVELRREKGRPDSWYAWQFHWVGNTPLEPQHHPLSLQKQQHYTQCILGREHSVTKKSAAAN